MSQLRSPSTRLPDHDRPACAALCASTAAWPPSVCKYKTATQAKEGVGTGAYVPTSHAAGPASQEPVTAAPVPVVSDEPVATEEEKDGWKENPEVIRM